MKDTYRHKGLRRQLIQKLRQKGIKAERVLKAMGSMPRHFFMDKAFEELAYQDNAFPIGFKQTISQPFTVAYQTQLLEIEKRDKVLEIGTGSGYQAAILALLGARVYTVERQEGLFHETQKRLKSLGFEGVRCYLRDGTKGLPEYAPFDKILVTAGAEEITEALKKQLKVGGILVIPVGREVQKMYKIVRKGPDDFEETILDSFRFVPFLKGIERLD